MTYKVSVSSPYNFSVKKTKSTSYKASLSFQLDVAQSLNDLTDVQLSGVSNSYVLMYDASIGKWKGVNPDTIISAAATEPVQPGLPADFVNALDVDLDNKIDLDAGGF